VPESKKDEFVARATAAVRDTYGTTEEERRASEDYCRLVDRHGVDRLHGLVREAVARGAHVEIGGDGDPEERYFAPTILTNVDPASHLMREEIFGPVLPIVSYGTLEEALDFVHRNGKPLALYVFSDREDVIERVLRETTSGGTVVNNVVLHLANPNLPFGGVGESGMGNYHGEYGFRTFSHERAVLKQGVADVFRYLYPPYTPTVRRIVKSVTHWHRT
jgi:aldehyde dehydrogenase (NAD+)